MGLPSFRQSRKPCTVFTEHKIFTASAFLTVSISLLSHRDSGITRDSKRVFGIFRTKLTRSKEASSDQKELHRCISTVLMDITIHS